MSLDTKIAQYHRSKSGNPSTGAGSTPVPTSGLTAADAGLMAINFAGDTPADKAAGKAAVYSYDGAAWELLNDVAAISTQTIDLTGVPLANIGAKYVAAGNPALTGDVIIATYGTPAGAFLLTTKGHPELSGSWTALGSATAVATDAEIGLAGAVTTLDNAKMITARGLRAEINRLLAGTDATKATSITTTGGNGAADNGKILILGATGLLPTGLLPIATAAETADESLSDKLVTPAGLRAELERALGVLAATLKAGAAGIINGGGVPDASGKIPLLGPGGHIDASFLNINGLNFIGATDMTAAVPAAPAGGYQNGDVYTHAGAVAAPLAGWGFNADVTSVEPGDMALYDGTAWHHIATAADLSNVVLKAGANAMAADAALNWTDPGTADTVIIDGAVAANAVIDHVTLKNSVINGGTF